MKFYFLQKDLWPIAKAVIKYYTGKRYKSILCEKPVSRQYLFNPCLTCKKGRSTIIVEIYERPNFQNYFEDFVKDCLRNRERFEIV